jgi:hypothetical protein
MKKYRIIIFIAIILSICFSSCQKVIDLELNTSSSQIVIQGNIYDQTGPYTVKISKSVNFDESNVYPAVIGAMVVISDNAGNSDTLTETSSGIYTTSVLQGVPGRTYTLTVKTDGQTYTASATLPDAVEINSIYMEKSRFGNDEQVTIDFTDPANVDNYYRLIEFINNIQQDQFYATSDKLYEGEKISYSFMSQDSDSKLETGDKVTIWLECVDKFVYEYFRTAGSEGGQSASPANPTSNISNGALGYFNACSVRAISIIAK